MTLGLITIQAWDPSDEEIFSPGYEKNQVQSMLGGPKLERMWSKSAVLNGRTLCSASLTTRYLDWNKARIESELD